MPAPPFTPIDGVGRPVPGEEVMHAIGEAVAAKLPDVPIDDPYRGALAALALVARRPDAVSPRGV